MNFPTFIGVVASSASKPPAPCCTITYPGTGTGFRVYGSMYGDNGLYVETATGYVFGDAYGDMDWQLLLSGTRKYYTNESNSDQILVWTNDRDMSGMYSAWCLCYKSCVYPDPTMSSPFTSWFYDSSAATCPTVHDDHDFAMGVTSQNDYVVVSGHATSAANGTYNPVDNAMDMNGRLIYKHTTQNYYISWIPANYGEWGNPEAWFLCTDGYDPYNTAIAQKVSSAELPPNGTWDAP